MLDKITMTISRKELTHIINTEIVDASCNGLARPSQYVANCVNAILSAGSREKQGECSRCKGLGMVEDFDGFGHQLIRCIECNGTGIK